VNKEQLTEKITELENARKTLAETKAARDRAFQLMQIFKLSGLAGGTAEAHNEALLDHYFPAGRSSLSLENFRSLVQNESIRAKFVWASQPFAAVTQAEQETTRQATAVRQSFDDACRTLAVAGVADVRPSDANFGMVMANITPPFSLDKLNSAIRTVTGLYPNSPQQIFVWRQSADAAERHALVEEIILDHSRDANSRATERKRLLSRVPTEEMRQKVATIRERQRLRSLSVDDIRKENIFSQPPADNSGSGFRSLPDTITKLQIHQANPEQLRRWLKFYGPDNLNARLAGNQGE
jgi:hypothetical protein